MSDSNSSEEALDKTQEIINDKKSEKNHKEKKIKRKRTINNRPLHTLFCVSAETEETDRAEAVLTDAFITFEKIDGDRVSIKLTDEEKKLKKQQYKEKYNNRPDIIEKRKLQSLSEEGKLKRQRYAEDPLVKKRKKRQGRKRRKIMAAIKEEQPSVYQKYNEKISEEMKMEVPSQRGKKWVPREGWNIESSDDDDSAD